MPQNRGISSIYINSGRDWLKWWRGLKEYNVVMCIMWLIRVNFILVPELHMHSILRRSFIIELGNGRSYVRMPSTTVTFSDSDVVRLVLEFLLNRDLHISMLSLERETGVIIGVFPPPHLFSFGTILDGQWDDVIDFVQPLTAIAFRHEPIFEVSRHQYLELLCVRGEAARFATPSQLTRSCNSEQARAGVSKSRRTTVSVCCWRLRDLPIIRSTPAGTRAAPACISTRFGRSSNIYCRSNHRQQVQYWRRTGWSHDPAACQGTSVWVVCGVLSARGDWCCAGTRETPALLSGAGLDDAYVSLLVLVGSRATRRLLVSVRQRSLRIESSLSFDRIWRHPGPIRCLPRRDDRRRFLIRRRPSTGRAPSTSCRDRWTRMTAWRRDWPVPSWNYGQTRTRRFDGGSDVEIVCRVPS